MSATVSATKWAGSRSLLEHAREFMPGGVSSPFRAHFPVPLYLADGRGSHVTDVDGNDLIDYTLAWGPLILGHRHPQLVEAMVEAVQGPHTYGAQHRLEIEVAEKVCALVPCAERVIFTSSGSEAVQCAFRLARAHTGRNVILKFEGHYHGWMDSVLWSYKPARDAVGDIERPFRVPGSRGQVANSQDGLTILPWNRLDLVQRLFDQEGAKIAAVILEPVLCNSGCLWPAEGFLEGLRSVTREHSALLIFDEVITGFRMHPGGAQAYFGVTPDLATFGKALGGGLPLSAITGRAEVMEEMLHGAVFGGTFNGNPVSLAAAKATLEAISRDDGSALTKAQSLGQTLREGLEQKALEHGESLLTTGFGTAFSVHFREAPAPAQYRDLFQNDGAKLKRWIADMLEHGIYLLPDGRLYLSLAHTDADVAQTVEAAGEVFQSWSAQG